MKEKFAVFAQNLAYYNEGMLVGDWIELPQLPEIIDKYLKETVKIDEEHEEYEIADIDKVPFPYSSIQWSDLHELNNLAIIYNTLTIEQKEAIQAYLESDGEEHYCISELINICLQADEIDYYRYYFEGIKYSQDCPPEIKMGYTMAEEFGIHQTLEKLGILDYFDFEKYGNSFGYDYNLLENGYFTYEHNLDPNYYSKEEIQEKIESILLQNKNKEENDYEKAI